MTELLKKIISKDNLLYAWGKYENFVINDLDFIADIEEYEHFSINLDLEINKIIQDLKKGTYKSSKLIFMPMPKGINEASGKAQYRQFFHVSIRDQIVWLAIFNIIGPELDSKMPFWSFGNRLYFPVWKEEVGGNKVLRCGKYMPSSKKIYRKWSQSWPLYRKAIRITVKLMGKGELNKIDDEEEIGFNEGYSSEFKIKYWEKRYWKKDNKDIYWGGIDFSKFYPNVNHQLIKENFFKYGFKNSLFLDEEKKEIGVIIDELMRFELSDKNMVNATLDTNGFNNKFCHSGIPTGLAVGGFLANVAMLEIDHQVVEILKKNRNIAHFRYVDDHVFLANSFDKLIEWINGYECMLEQIGLKDIFNTDKTEPKELKCYLESLKVCDKEKAVESTLLDPKFPKPLMSATLKKMSDLNHRNVVLMTNEEKLIHKDDLVYMLISEIAENELRSSTRVSWASSMLNKTVPEINFLTSEKYQKRLDIAKINSKINKSKKNNSAYSDKGELNNLKEIQDLEKDRDKRIRELEKIRGDVVKKEENLFREIFNIYLKNTKENYAKAASWSKTVSFCKNTGYDGLTQLFGELELYYNKEYLEHNGYFYIKASLFWQLSHEIISSISMIKSNKIQSKNKRRLQQFLCNVTKLQLNEECGMYEQQRDLYSIARDIACNFAKGEICDSSVQLVANEVNANHFNLLKQYYINDYVIIGERNNEFLNGLRLKTMQTNYIESFQSNNKQIMAVFLEEKAIRIAEREKKYNKPNQQMNLLEIICKMNDKCVDGGVCDTEIYALNLIKHVAICMKDKSYISIGNLSELDAITENYVLNPINFIFKDNKKDIFAFKRVSSMKTYFYSEDNRVSRFKYINSGAPIDLRYLPKVNNLGITLNEEKFFLGVLLCKMLSKEARFPEVCNSLNSSRLVSFAYLSNIDSWQISSWTKAIILGCLSTNDKDAKFASEFLQAVNNDRAETLKGPIIFYSLDDIIECIDATIDLLHKYQYNLRNEVRQLVPVRFEQFNKTQNPFK
ncbi:MAG: RNA-directed DNA polymerase [Bacillota bacterium]